MTTNNMNNVDEMIAYHVKKAVQAECRKIILLEQRLLQDKKEMDSLRSSLEGSETLVMKLEAKVSNLKRGMDEAKSAEAATRSTNKELKNKCSVQKRLIRSMMEKEGGGATKKETGQGWVGRKGTGQGWAARK